MDAYFSGHGSDRIEIDGRLKISTGVVLSQVRQEMFVMCRHDNKNDRYHLLMYSVKNGGVYFVVVLSYDHVIVTIFEVKGDSLASFTPEQIQRANKLGKRFYSQYKLDTLVEDMFTPVDEYQLEVIRSRIEREYYQKVRVEVVYWGRTKQRKTTVLEYKKHRLFDLSYYADDLKTQLLLKHDLSASYVFTEMVRVLKWYRGDEVVYTKRGLGVFNNLERLKVSKKQRKKR